MKNTLFILVSCCLENSRTDVLKSVVENIRFQPNFSDIRDSLIVFDNNSTTLNDGELRDLFFDFKHVYRANKNVGYWTALKWVVDHHKEIVGSKRFVYPIESDCLHDDLQKLQECIDFLDVNDDVGVIRTQEFEVVNRNLYDKENPIKNSRVYAWQTQRNRFRKRERVYFNHASGSVYRTNFTAVVCSLARTSDMKQALHELSTRDSMSEADYQKLFDHYTENGLYDGGLFHSKLSFTPGAVAGSRPWTHGNTGYRSTQHDKIDQEDSFVVSKQPTITTSQLEHRETNDGFTFSVYRDYDSWHDGYKPKMVNVLVMNPNSESDIILHKRQASMLTVISGNVKLSYKHDGATVRELSLKNENTSTVILIPPGIPVRLINESNDEHATIINAAMPACKPKSKGVLRFKNWSCYDDYKKKV